MTDLSEALHLGPWLLYAIVLIAPSVQEDSAVIGAAALAVSERADPLALFALVLAGLTFSDIWKYWAGAWLPRLPLVRKQLARPRVGATRAAVLERLGVSLLTARFIPGLRIPTYVACGAFGANFQRYLLILTLAGAPYVGVAFALMWALGEAGIQYLTLIIPIVLVSTVALGLTAAFIARLGRAQRRSRAATGLVSLH
jgi:membrane protein DedA with SNARE-associated domain